VSASAAQLLQQRLGLTEDELCTVLAVAPLSLIAGDELAHRPELPLLLALTAEREPDALRAWLRTGPIDLLLARDFAAFEDALEGLD
jgi:hypothetical protein